MTTFIGLGNYSRTGKDSLANAILRHLAAIDPSIKAIKRSLAWKLKDISHQLYAWAGLREPEFYDTLEGEAFRQVKLPELNMTPVEVWVQLGTPAIREKVYDATWIKHVLTIQDCDVVVVPDVRFPNEVAAIRKANGLLVKVVRPGYGPLPTVADMALMDYDGWDVVVGGSGNMSELDWWGSRIATWLAGGERPFQTAEVRAAQLAVEKK